MRDVAKSDSHSINQIGYESLTLKEMFETSIGYPITDSEPQIFCGSCVNSLVSWYNFNAVCSKTQQLLVAPPSAKNETFEENDTFETETIWCNETIKEEESDLLTEEEMGENFDPMTRVETTIEAQTSEITDYEITVTFETYLRDFKGQKKNLLGDYIISGHNYNDFMENLWNAVKTHLVRKINFTESGNAYFSNELPTQKDIFKFVEFNDKLAKKRTGHLNEQSLRHISKKQMQLHIYKYSKAVETKEMWGKVMKLIEKTNTSCDTFVEKKPKIMKKDTTFELK